MLWRRVDLVLLLEAQGVYTDMQWWESIRHRVLRQGVSKRQVMQETGIHWTTLQKILEHPEPPGYQQSKPRPKPKLGPYIPRIQEILQQDRAVPRKQRHTARRICDRLKAEGYRGGYTQVKQAVRELRRHSQEVYIPLEHRPGHAQMDVGQALVQMWGVLRKVFFFVMCLPYSDAFFVQVFERACTESFWEFHRRAFAYFGGVPQRITYDNDRVLVAKVISTRKRRLTDGFLQLKSHYLFDVHFCNVRRPNEKGVVEVTIRYARANFLVPVPAVRDLEELNRELVERCRQDLTRQLRGKQASKQVLLEDDRQALGPLPEGAFDACRKASTTVSSLSLVRFDGNDYSVPVRFAHRPVVVNGYVDRVQICRNDQVIATHTRLWDRGDVSLDPTHYLALLERKPGALDHGRPFTDWDLPECFSVLRARLEHEQAGEGTREYIRVLRLLEKHSFAAVTRAVEHGLRANALLRDAIAQFLIPQEDWRQTSFHLDGREHLRHVRVAHTDISSYAALVERGGIP